MKQEFLHKKMKPGEHPTAFTLRVDLIESEKKEAGVTVSDNSVKAQIFAGFSSG